MFNYSHDYQETDIIFLTDSITTTIFKAKYIYFYIRTRSPTRNYLPRALSAFIDTVGSIESYSGSAMNIS